MAGLHLTAKDGKEAMQGVTIEVDVREYLRGAFGRGRWRFLLGILLLRIGACVLGCKFDVIRENAEKSND